MRIPCPFCGTRDSQEFVYRGDATATRPLQDDGEAAFYEYVYVRANIAGTMSEHWYHAQGCRNWLIVRRSTLSHAIEGTELASGGSG